MVGSAALPALKAVATTTPLIVTVDAGGVAGAVSLPPQALRAAAAMAVRTSVVDRGAYFMLGVISILKCSWGAGQRARWPGATANGETPRRQSTGGSGILTNIYDRTMTFV